MGKSTVSIPLSRLATFLLLVTLLVVSACKGNKPESIRIGVYAALTGTTATFGQSTQKGVDLAVDQANAGGGVLGKQISVRYEDDQGRPEEAQTVVTKLINQDRVVAVIGENASSRTLAAGPVAQSAKIPMITPSSTNPRVTEVGDYIFRVCFIDPFQGLVMARFAANNLKVRNVAILQDIKNDYSVGLSEVFRNNFQKLGGKIVGEQSYSEGDSDFSAQLTSLKASSPEAIFIPGYYTEVGLIARQARKLGLTVPLLGADGWESPKLWEIGGESLNDCYYSNHYSLDDPSPAIQTFVKQFKERYNETPDAVAALGYDAARVLISAIQRAGSLNSAALRDAIAATRDFAGVTGKITIDEKRNAVKPAVVLKIKNGRLEYVQTIQPD
jgi:branched-chain amino acid transport system substrate-binding protein